MPVTKVWVRRPNSSPIRIKIPSSVSTPNYSLPSNGARDTPRPIDFDLTEEFLVDDLREAILKKYPQSLGKHHDSADLTIRIHDNDEPDKGRILSPEESVAKILMEEYPNGQKSSEAWTIITSGGRDNYTRWWLQTGGFSNDLYSLRGKFSPNQFMQSSGGSYGSDPAYSQQQEYFPYTPQKTSASPPGDVSARPKATGPIMSINQHSRTQARPSLRENRSTVQDGIAIFPGRRYDNTNTFSMAIEPTSGGDSEASRTQHRNSPDSNGSSVGHRYPPGRNTPPVEYATRPRGYSKSGPSASIQPFHMQIPPQQIPSSAPKVSSPLGGPPILPPQRLSQGSYGRSTVANAPNATVTVPRESPVQQTSSPKFPESGNASSRGGGLAPIVSTGSPVGPTTFPASRQRSNTITGVAPPTIPNPHVSPSADRTADVTVVKPKPETGTVLGVIPPINVLIVEDNMINAQILEAFFRKRKLKYATAVNGKEAVEKWRQGGWHLVLVSYCLHPLLTIRWTFNSRSCQESKPQRKSVVWRE